jgi:hypothetical protein
MQLKRFLRRALLFSLPVLAWVLLVLVVDPFNYFNLVHTFSKDMKFQNAGALNTLMFRMFQEVHDPAENVLIGDSRTEDLPVDQIDQLTGTTYAQLSANALKLNEVVDLFYFANRLKPLKHVVIGVNFNMYNQYAYADRVHSVEAMVRNPLIYVFDRNVAQAAYYVLKAWITQHRPFDTVPPIGPEQFWTYIATVRAREHYGKYRHPDTVQNQLQEMVNFAKAQGTRVTFIIVPHHGDFQKQVKEYGLTAEYVRFKREMSQLDARVIDYDYVNQITSERTNFRDPIHSNGQIGKLIVHEVFAGPLVIGKLMNESWAEQCSKYLF